ncbi:MAG: site-specific integrase [Ruminococcus sp.]|nr:site-specific integrase [Ruminococcus sp.]
MNIQKRVSKSGVASYLIRVSLGYVNGQQIVKSMTYKPDKNMTPKQIEKEVNRQAVLFEEQAKKEYKEMQERENDELDFLKQCITFKELAEEWLQLQEDTNELKPSSLLRMKNCTERTYNFLGNTLVVKLSYRKIQSFITSLSKDGVNQNTGKGLSQKTQKHYLTFISNVMLYAKKCGIIEYNPCRDITFSKSEHKEINVYSLSEMRKMLSLIDEKAPTDYKLFFNLLAYSGMRRGEVLGLEYKDINFDTSVLTIKRTSNYRSGVGLYTDTPKTKSSYRSLVIQSKLIELIKQLSDEQREQAKKCGELWCDTDRLFVTWDGKPMHPNTPYTWLERFCKLEEIPFKGLHSFRHFVATQALTSGVDVKSVSAMLGHSQTSTTLNVYAHAVQETNEKALNSVAQLLEST